MRFFREFLDSRLRDGRCVYCDNRGGTRDHIPPRFLLDPPYPDNLIVVPACRRCNDRAAPDEQYVVCLLDAIAAGGVEEAAARRPDIARTFDKRPTLAREIRSIFETSADPLAGQEQAERLNRFVEKIARGIASFEVGDVDNRTYARRRFALLPRMDDETRRDFLTVRGGPLLPEIGSRWLDRLVRAGMTNKWEVVQSGRFAYAVELDGSATRVKFVAADTLAAELVFESREQ